MLATKILFAILIVICSFFYILYLWGFALVLLIVMLALPVLMFIITLIAKFSMSAEFALQTRTAAKNEKFMVQLCLTNRCIFPVGKAEAHIEYYNIFSNSISAFDILMPVQPRNTQRVTFSLSSEYCGQLMLRTVYINIFDPLRIFRMKTCRNISAQIAVMPGFHEIEASLAETMVSDEECEHYSENKPGDDPSEVFGLREYTPGDKLNRIHWKLSSKKEEFIVKDYSLPLDSPSVIFADLKCYDDSQHTLPVFDTMIETLTSLSHFLTENERIHKIVFFSARQGGFKEIEILGSESLSAAVGELIGSFSDNLFSGEPTAYFAERKAGEVSSFTIITSDFSGKAAALLGDGVNAEIKNAIVVTPSADIKVPEISESVRVIPVAAGHISASIKDLEL